MKNLVSRERYTVLIPARLASSRLPNKPLADIAGVPMVVRVAQRVINGISPESNVIVAADHIEIMRACEAFGVKAILTRVEHASGSDRLAEASRILELGDDAIVVNVQGDEPLIEPELVENVARMLESSDQASMATAAHPISSVADFANPNVVKVVTDAHGIAMYFSRAPVPWWRDGPLAGQVCLPTPRPLRHIGIYAYRARFLRTFPTLAPAPIESTEALEQLRAMWHGYRIAVHVTSTEPGPGVDTPADLERVRQLFAGKT